MSTGRHSDTDPQTNRQETAPSRVDSAPSNTTDSSTNAAPFHVTEAKPPHDPHLSVHVPIKREGTHRTIETEPLGSKKPSLPSATVEEKTTSSTKEQVRNIERTSDLQREIPRLLEQKRQTLQAQKTFFVTEHYDEWQDTFISAEENPLPADFFEVNVEALSPEFFTNHLNELPPEFSANSPEELAPECFTHPQEELSPEFFADHPEESVSKDSVYIPEASRSAFSESHSEALPPELFANQTEEETLDVRPEDTDFPDILDIGEVKTSDDSFHDTVILKVPDKS